MKWYLDLFSAVIVTGFAVWLAVPSSVFIRDVSLIVNGNRVTYVRETPFGGVTAAWQSEIRMIDGNGFECHSGGWGVAFYQRDRDNTVNYDMGSWADACIESGPPFYITDTKRVLIGGVIPLRKMITTTHVIGLE